MQETWKMFGFFVLISVTPLVAEQNPLNGACGYEGLSLEHIYRLNSWKGSSKISIGVGNDFHSTDTWPLGDKGLVIKNFDHSKDHLRDIAFEDDESSPVNFVVEVDRKKGL